MMVTNGILLPEFWIRGDITETRLYDFGTWVHVDERITGVELTDPDEEPVTAVMQDGVLMMVTVGPTAAMRTKLIGKVITERREIPITIFVVNWSLKNG